jgi:hypothetical protein
MEIAKIILKYYSLKMLLTVDLNNLITVLLSVFGESIQLDLLAMNEDERLHCSSSEEGILRVNERIWVLEVRQDGSAHRREDLEQRIVEEGQK